MNQPTTGERAATTARRFTCVLALVLLFSTLGAASVPADTPDGEMVDGIGYHENLLSTMTRHKTH
jgi:hypothetical protein